MTHSNLIPVFNGKIQNQSIQLANARELHQFLESKQQYSHWIKDRITEYGFIENEDYIIITERTAGRPRKEYHITLDMGKELGMVERNEKGRQIRQYFIKLEKQQKTTQIAPLAISTDTQEQALALLIKLYGFGLQASEMQRKLHNTPLANQLNATIGGQYLHNFQYPLQQTLDQAKAFVHANTERLALMKAVQQLLN